MLPFLAAAAPAAISAVSSFLGTRSANRTNRAISREQMGFQESQSSTAYQRAMEDMRKAGLNPILAYQQGGASTPSGASANMQDAVTPGVNSAMGALRLKADIENIHENSEKLRTDQALNRALQESAKADAFFKANSAKNVQMNTLLAGYQVPGARNQAAIEDSTFGQVLNYVDRGAKSTGGVVDVIKPKAGLGSLMRDVRSLFKFKSSPRSSRRR